MIDPAKIDAACGTKGIVNEYEAWLRADTIRKLSSGHWKNGPIFKTFDNVSPHLYFSYFFDFLSDKRYKNWKRLIKEKNDERMFYDFIFVNLEFLPVKKMIESVIIGKDMKRGIWMHFEDLHQYPKSLMTILNFIDLPSEFLNVYDALKPELFSCKDEISLRFLEALIKTQRLPQQLFHRLISKIEKYPLLKTAMKSTKWRSQYEAENPSAMRKLIYTEE